MAALSSRAPTTGEPVMSYTERFQQPEQASSYDLQQYGPSTQDSFLWSLEQDVLRSILERHGTAATKRRLLDFACGTGRVLSFLENLVDETDGVDISRAMVNRASSRCRRSKLFVGDIVEDRSLVAGPYDVITAFRFLLNADAPLRERVLPALRERIGDGGLLIANLHGNAHSLRHFSLAYRKWRIRRSAANQPHNDLMLAELTPAAVRKLFRASGFDVVEEIGLGILPQLVYKTPLQPLARWIDRTLSGIHALRGVSIDLVFVCKPANQLRRSDSESAASSLPSPAHKAV